MSSSTPNAPTEFAQAAIELDADFKTFERLAREINSLSIQSDGGFERAQKLLVKLDGAGKRIGTGMQKLAQELDGMRQRTEVAAEQVSARAVLIHERQQESERLAQKLRGLSEVVRKITASVVQIKQSSEAAVSPSEKGLLAEKLPEINAQLGLLVDETLKLKTEAQTANLRVFEKSADSLRQSLQAARNRLGLLVERQNPPQLS